MSLKYFIEQVKINSLEKYHNVSVRGWCVDTDTGAIPEILLSLNGKNARYSFVAVPKPDVCAEYHLTNDSLSCGFRLLVKSKSAITSLKAAAVTEEGKEIILKMNEKELSKVTSGETIEYAIDAVHQEEDSNMVNVDGWAVSYLHEDIDLKIVDSDGNEKETVKRIVSREDLVRLKYAEKDQVFCGFAINFQSEKKKKYFLRIHSASFDKEIDLYKVMHTKHHILDLIRAVDKENIKKAFIYYRKNGFRKLLKKLAIVKPKKFLYNDWFIRNRANSEELAKQRAASLDYAPKISILVPTYNTPDNYLRAMLDSVVDQTYPNWELCIAEGSDPDHSARKTILEYAKKDPRIKVKILDKNYGISGNTNEALSLATGEYTGLFDHDDLLEPDILFEVAAALQDKKHDIIYTDEDKLNSEKNMFEDPNLKPDFSMDLFRSHNYITHFFVVKTQILKDINGFRSEFDGAQDYDVMFRCIERSESICHIPKVLYHWRMHAASTAQDPESKMYCYEAGKKAIEEHLRRTGVPGTVEMMPKPFWGTYHTRYETPGDPLVSVIIPNYEHKSVLETCVNSLFEVNTYKNIEIIIVENNSKSEEIFNYYDELQKLHDNVRVVTWDGGEFNYSAINNYGVTFARGDYLLLLNNDTEVISPDAISEMLGCCMREEVGAVGAKLLYEDDTIQHAGVVIGFGGYAGHVFHGLGRNDYGFMLRPLLNCNYSAVTAACMMVDRRCFEACGGFDESFRVAGNDVDLCLKIRSLDKLIVYNAFALWHHYESKSRGYEDNLDKVKRFEEEIEHFREKWKPVIDAGDPFYNKNFKIEDGPFILT